MPVQGGEGQAPPKSRWQNRPHQKFVHLVFLSARPESFKGLTVRRLSCVICAYTLCVPADFAMSMSCGHNWRSRIAADGILAACRKRCRSGRFFGLLCGGGK